MAGDEFDDALSLLEASGLARLNCETEGPGIWFHSLTQAFGLSIMKREEASAITAALVGEFYQWIEMSEHIDRWVPTEVYELDFYRLKNAVKHVDDESLLNANVCLWRLFTYEQKDERAIELIDEAIGLCESHKDEEAWQKYLPKFLLHKGMNLHRLAKLTEAKESYMKGANITIFDLNIAADLSFYLGHLMIELENAESQALRFWKKAITTLEEVVPGDWDVIMRNRELFQMTIRLLRLYHAAASLEPQTFEEKFTVLNVEIEKRAKVTQTFNWQFWFDPKPPFEGRQLQYALYMDTSLSEEE